MTTSGGLTCVKSFPASRRNEPDPDDPAGMLRDPAGWNSPASRMRAPQPVTPG